MARNARLRLAIVDDDDDVRRAVARLLGAMGHEVQLFASAEEFEVHILDVDCVIVDVRLPGRDGLELRERLRARRTAAPVVLITGDRDRLAREVSQGDTPVVAKPFDADALVAAITDAMAATEPVREL
jgi:FixJ family two-component response regulator